MLSTSPSSCPLCQNKMHQLATDLFDDRYGAPGKHTVFQCDNCQYAITTPGLEKSKIGSFYQRYYPLKQVDPLALLKNSVPPHKFISYLLGLGHTCHWYTIKGTNVLDIGSGSGQSLIEIATLGGKAYGVEPDPTAQKIAKKLKLKVYQGFITDKPFPRVKFDLITASQVIEHEPDPLNLLRAVNVKLKPHGLMVFSTPNLNSLGRLLYGNKWLNWHIPYHLSFFTAKTVGLLARKAGFRVISLKTVTPTLWTVLQWQMLTAKAKEGQASSLWSGTSTSYLGKLILYSLAFPYSRILDILGMGESLVVKLEKK